MRRVAILIFISIFSLQQLPQALADFPRDSDSQKALKMCAISTEVDCIESLQTIYPSGKSSNLILTGAVIGSSKDEYGQVNENGVSQWLYLDAKGSKKAVTINATLTPENYKSPAYKRLYPSMWFIFSGLDKEAIDSGIKFQVVLRTSWLNPQGVGMFAAKSNFTREIKSYGSRYIFQGAPFLSTSFSKPELFQKLNTELQDETVSDGEFAQLYFVVDHRSSIPGGSFWGDACSDFGYSVTSSNAIGAGQPYMSDNETLRFNIGAPHRLSTGEITEGFFTTDIPVAYIDCRWPQNTLTKSPKVEVVVTNSDGSTQVATTSINLDRGVLKVRAFGFHYSQPTIVVRATNKSEIPELKEIGDIQSNTTQTVSKSKKIAITCVKGKLIKKVSAVNPQCPTVTKKSDSKVVMSMAIAHYAYTALDCDNPVQLANFYSKITGQKVQPFDEGETAESCEWLELLDESGFTKMAFQKIDNYQKPTWPTGGLPQQAHMDFHAKDLDIAEKQLLENGAIKAEFQPKPNRFRIYFDLAGHPFCIVQSDHESCR